MSTSTDPPPPSAVPVDELTAAGLDPAIARRWGSHVPPAYLHALGPGVVVEDLRTLASLEAIDPPPEQVTFGFAAGSGSDAPISLRGYHRDGVLELSRLVPVLERLGFWVVDGRHWPVDGWQVHDVRLRLSDGGGVDVAADGDRWADAVAACWDGRAEVDELNGLVTVSALTWEDLVVLRALVGHRLQVDARYPLARTADTLVRHPDLAAGIVELFALRMHPERRDLEAAEARAASLLAACDGVVRLDDDRILRGLVGTVTAVVRTTCWRGGGPLAVKLDPALVPGLPEPLPAHEVWVSGRLPGGGTIRGVHLRAGDVARGGIRWSSRPDDLRAEVLDLMTTQVLKNAPIVPTGAKGGFVVDGADAATAYDAFVGSLLDLTDDLVDGEVVPVDGRLDGDDTYLVVAADRGTATFSDRANALAAARDYWLGDAFASGGSNGYDHKELGITARGAWEAVVHHFAGLGVDPMEEPVTVVGIGDMSGDVFGNFMVRSPHLALVAAFDHRHVFVDPRPDPARSFAERRRLASLPRSTWDDYDRSLLSEGGFVVSRDEKQVVLERPVREALRIDAEAVTPAELIRAVLCAPVDLLFAGGVGTFVRAADEDDRTLDDRANAEVRVEAEALRARVVGEGANLAFTQRARIAYARRGGRVNRDAIDNAAGVDTSDQEVNLKILLDLAVRRGHLDPTERNPLLHAQTDRVVEHVLGRVRRQCERLTVSESASGPQRAWFERLLIDLVRQGTLDPDVEDLPDAEELAARRAAGAGLTRPELAVLLAGAKRWLTAEVLASDLPDQPATRELLADAFPDEVARRFDDLLDDHPLRRELVTSGIVNDVVDQLGMTFVHRIAADCGAEPAAVVSAALVAVGVVDARTWWDRLAVPPSGALVDPEAGDARRLVVDLCERLTRDELARRTAGPRDVASRVAADRPVAEEVAVALAADGGPGQRRARDRRARALTGAGWDPYVATDLAVLPELVIVPRVAALSRELGRSPSEVVAAHAALDDRLDVVRLAADLEALPVAGRWTAAARQATLDELADVSDAVLASALADHRGLDGAAAVTEHLASRAEGVGRAVAVRREVQADPGSGLAGLAVAVRALRALG